ncbi:MAG: prepilin peptidase [Lachnospiraceae bacterium]|nr:prepilin peptidase [Lachnospiraceae bacterium]
MINAIIYRIIVIGIGILLFAAGLIDIKSRQISRRMIVVLFLACCATLPFRRYISILDTVGGLAVGLSIIGLSVISKEQIGKGDGLVLAAVGIAFGARRCFLVLCIASFLMCMTAIGLLFLRRGSRQTRLPFLPALFAGYLLCVVL